MLDAALRYRDAGLCCCRRYAAGSGRRCRAGNPSKIAFPTERSSASWFANGADAICLVSGSVSGHLEMIDFDHGGELFEAWCTRIDPGLWDENWSLKPAQSAADT